MLIRGFFAVRQAPHHAPLPVVAVPHGLLELPQGVVVALGLADERGAVGQVKLGRVIAGRDRVIPGKALQLEDKGGGLPSGDPYFWFVQCCL